MWGDWPGRWWGASCWDVGTLDQQLLLHLGLQLPGGEDCGGGVPEEAAEDFYGAQTESHEISSFCPNIQDLEELASRLLLHLHHQDHGEDDELEDGKDLAARVELLTALQDQSLMKTPH